MVAPVGQPPERGSAWPLDTLPNQSALNAKDRAMQDRHTALGADMLAQPAGARRISAKEPCKRRLALVAEAVEAVGRHSVPGKYDRRKLIIGDGKYPGRTGATEEGQQNRQCLSRPLPTLLGQHDNVVVDAADRIAANSALELVAASATCLFHRVPETCSAAKEAPRRAPQPSSGRDAPLEFRAQCRPGGLQPRGDGRRLSADHLRLCIFWPRTCGRQPD